MRGEALHALSRQAARTVAHVRMDMALGKTAGTASAAAGHDALLYTPGICEQFVACLHDPWGSHAMLRQGCNSFQGGWIDVATGRVPRTPNGAAKSLVEPIYLPNLRIQ